MAPPLTAPADASRDIAMPFLASALDVQAAGGPVGRALRRSLDRDLRAEVVGARLVRYKPGRRALIEYDVLLHGRGTHAVHLHVMGKAKARRLDLATCGLMDCLCRNGFDADSADGISVPRPIAMVPEFHMFLQPRMNGSPLGEFLHGPKAVELVQRAAETAWKLHRSGVPAQRSHTIADEVAALRARLEAVAAARPQMASRLADVYGRCVASSMTIETVGGAGVHRDYYPDQLLVEGSRMFLLDLDLYASGDPSLDAGNFIGHLTEWSLRTLGDPEGLLQLERAFEIAFLERAGENRRRAVRVYTALTLARHIYISTQFPDRQHLTTALLDICGQRLDALVQRAR